jgi:hypothetical protein
VHLRGLIQALRSDTSKDGCAAALAQCPWFFETGTGINLEGDQDSGNCDRSRSVRNAVGRLVAGFLVDLFAKPIYVGSSTPCIPPLILSSTTLLWPPPIITIGKPKFHCEHVWNPRRTSPWPSRCCAHSIADLTAALQRRKTEPDRSAPPEPIWLARTHACKYLLPQPYATAMAPVCVCDGGQRVSRRRHGLAPGTSSIPGADEDQPRPPRSGLSGSPREPHCTPCSIIEPSLLIEYVPDPILDFVVPALDRSEPLRHRRDRCIEPSRTRPRRRGIDHTPLRRLYKPSSYPPRSISLAPHP